MANVLTAEEKLARIAEIKASYENADAAIKEREDYRWKNYYDCIDDYSVCGICQRADDQARYQAQLIRDTRIAEVENDGIHFENGDYWGLMDADGNIVAEGINYGDYGKYFSLFAGGYVGLPKKLSTLTKKGYKLFHRTCVYECVMKDVSFELRIHNKSMKATNLVTTIWEDKNIPVDEIVKMPYSDYQYYTRFAS